MKKLFLALFLTLLFALAADAAQLLTSARSERPAIVLAAFGTSTKARATYDYLEAEVRKAFPDYRVEWAFTSEVIRERVNKKYAKEGKPERLKSLQQVLADLEAEGFKTAVVQPIHIFPGEEYEEVLSITGNFPGVRVETGEALMQRWETMFMLVGALSKDFLPPAEGVNVLVAHGTPMTNVASNIAYMGLDRYLRLNFPNVLLGGVDGVAGRDEALAAAAGWPAKKVRFIPFMYVGGDHIMNDVMGDDKANWDESWRARMEKRGFAVEALTVTRDGVSYYKGLGFMEETVKVFLSEIKRCLDRI